MKETRWREKVHRDEKSKQRNKIKAKVDSEIAIYDKLYICF